MKKYTIKDIAELAGVSKGTVDRVIHKRGKVSKKSYDKVVKLLEEIDYHPNPIARNLKNNKIYTIVVIFPDPNEDSFWRPCLDSIHEIKSEFKLFGILIDTTFFNPANTTSFKRACELVESQAPDAVLVAPIFYTETIKAIKRFNALNIMVSTFNNQIKTDGIVNFVGQDLFQSGRTAARLIDLITPPNAEILIIHIDEAFNNALHMQEKESGFRKYFEETENNALTLKTFNKKKSELKELIGNYAKHPHKTFGIFITTSKAYLVAEIIQHLDAKNISVIGYDLLNKNIDHLKNKTIQFLIHQNPKRQSYLGLTYLIEHFLFNKKIKPQKLLPIDIVSSENIAHYVDH